MRNKRCYSYSSILQNVMRKADQILNNDAFKRQLAKKGSWTSLKIQIKINFYFGMTF